MLYRVRTIESVPYSVDEVGGSVILRGVLKGVCCGFYFGVDVCAGLVVFIVFMYFCVVFVQGVVFV